MKYLLPIALALSACAATTLPVLAHAEAAGHAVYDASRDAAADVEAALARVEGTERKVVVVMGANWCHDSRGLAEHFARSEIAPVIAAHYEVVWVDVGTPQRGEARNQELADRFGITPLVGTPTVVVLDGSGAMLNSEADARSWRNAYSREADDVLAYFADMAAR